MNCVNDLGLQQIGTNGTKITGTNTMARVTAVENPPRRTSTSYVHNWNSVLDSLPQSQINWTPTSEGKYPRSYLLVQEQT